MKEDFLHYVWKYRLFNTAALFTAEGKALSILQPGQHNFHGGPDFLNARLRIGDELWTGHVEIHLRSSDWHRHGHTEDEHYKNVILHAVMENDKNIHLRQPGDLPVLIMAPYIIEDQFRKYQQWMNSKTWIPCETRISEIDDLLWTNLKDRLLIERLEQKSTAFMSQFEKTGGNWSEVFYRKLARNFGFKVNGDAMETLAESLPLNILTRHKSDPFQVEALLFGQAGFLNEIFTDDYPAHLQKEYLFLNRKYNLRPMNSSQWNFGKLRPSNFPTLRLAQFAALICSSEHLFSTILSTDHDQNMRHLLDVSVFEYWNSHYRFDALSSNDVQKMNTHEKKIGLQSIDNILINTVAVMLFTYGKYLSDQKQIDKAVKLLETCKAEDNRVLKKWSDLGVDCQNAADGQSMLQLYNVYCSARRCLHCQAGLKLLKAQ